MGLSTNIVATLGLLSTTGWAQYVLQDDYMSGDFFSKFSFWDSADPTNGFVQYQSASAAQSSGLISSSSGSAQMKVADSGITPNGRPSVRISSTETYSEGLVVVDVEHMPGGICGTWPAFWMVGPNWPAGGEIDIIEGVNQDSTNQMTLHTGPGCSIQNSASAFTGNLLTDNCDINAPGQGTNQGCSIATGNTNTYGSGFNANGGGVYATEITSSYIAIYFFPRGSVPSDVTGDSPDPSGWGEPLAKFEGSCDITSKFTDMQIVFDTTLCGDWAGDAWSSSSCSGQAATCEAFVANNPSAFSNAYWTVNALKVYSANGNGNSPAPSPSVAHSSPIPVSTPIVFSSVPQESTQVPTTFAISTKPNNPAPTGGWTIGGSQPVWSVPNVPATTPIASTPAATTTPSNGGGGWTVVGSQPQEPNPWATPAPSSTTDSNGWIPVVGGGGTILSGDGVANQVSQATSLIATASGKINRPTGGLFSNLPNPSKNTPVPSHRSSGVAAIATSSSNIRSAPAVTSSAAARTASPKPTNSPPEVETSSPAPASPTAVATPTTSCTDEAGAASTQQPSWGNFPNQWTGSEHADNNGGWDVGTHAGFHGAEAWKANFNGRHMRFHRHGHGHGHGHKHGH